MALTACLGTNSLDAEQAEDMTGLTELARAANIQQHLKGEQRRVPLGDEPATAAYMAIQAKFAAGTQSQLRLPVFQLAPFDEAKERVAVAARLLESDQLDPTKNTRLSATMIDDPMYVGTRVGDMEYRINRLSGSERLTNTSLFHLGKGSNDLNSTADYVAKAEEYIRNNAPTPILNSMYLYKIRRYEQTAEESESKELSQVSIAFNQSIAGLPTIGSGGKFAVHLTPDMRISGHESTIRLPADEVIVVKGDAIRSPDDAMRIAKGRLVQRGSLDDRFELSRAEFGYFQRGRNSVQSYLIPYYAFFWVPKAGVMGKQLIEIVSAVTGEIETQFVDEDERAELVRKAERLRDLEDSDAK